jgi:hypothetical protein
MGDRFELPAYLNPIAAIACHSNSTTNIPVSDCLDAEWQQHLWNSRENLPQGLIIGTMSSADLLCPADVGSIADESDHRTLPPTEGTQLPRHGNKCHRNRATRSKRARGPRAIDSIPIHKAQLSHLLATVPLLRKLHERQHLLATILAAIAKVEPTPIVVAALKVLREWLKYVSGNDLSHALSNGLVAGILRVVKFIM